jgi:hypothetical protein
MPFAALSQAQIDWVFSPPDTSDDYAECDLPASWVALVEINPTVEDRERLNWIAFEILDCGGNAKLRIEYLHNALYPQIVSKAAYILLEPFRPSVGANGSALLREAESIARTYLKGC